MSLRRASIAVIAMIGLIAGIAAECAAGAAADPSTDTGAAAPSTEGPAAETLTLLSVDARTLPGLAAKTADAPIPQWRTSFGSERRSVTAKSKPASAVDADIVLLQGVTDIPTLRRWFPAGLWRLVVSRQIFAGADTPGPPIATTAVAVRLRRGLRVTGQDHLLELSDALGKGAEATTAAGTAVRVLIDGRETWAVSVLLPPECAQDCPGRAALERWHQERERENVRRVTGGRFAWGPEPERGTGDCDVFGLRLDPAPPPPKLTFTKATQNPVLGCAASVAVAK